MSWLHKLCTAEQAVAHVRPGDHVFVGTACATPRVLVQALEACGPKLMADVQLLHFLTDGAVPHDAAGNSTSVLRHRCFFVGQDLRAPLRQGQAEYVPISAARLPELIALARVQVDVAFIQVSPPDEQGWVSLGLSVDIALAAIAAARLVVAEVNPAMPRTAGQSLVHVDRIHHLVQVDTPLIEYRHQQVASAVLSQIARYISSIIDDGSTLQMGMGRISNEVMGFLTDRKDLGIHSDVITDALLPLLQQGNLSGACKTQSRGRIVASFAMGTQALYARLHNNPLFEFRPLDDVADVRTIAAQHKMVSVTQAFMVDLSGQVCVDQLGGDNYGGLAAQVEFLQGASRSPGGKAIVCLSALQPDLHLATPGPTPSAIVPHLPAGTRASIACSDLHYVITEYGIAYLFGKSLRERALALIAVAHPDHRAALMLAAQQQGVVPADQQLRYLGAYPVQDERQLTLKDSRPILLRPAMATDEEGVRALFHTLSEREVYTRFFRTVRGLSNRDVQRLCNLNFEDEVAFVAVAGSREAPVVVGHACYFKEKRSGLAETAFMVHPQWQGCGVASALQTRMASHAQACGVRGFVAEILEGNNSMLRLAHAASSQSEAVTERDVVTVTALF
jgi:acyl-CoA hydrolase/L-amino acid N-acyltransferase YncA